MPQVYTLKLVPIAQRDEISEITTDIRRLFLKVLPAAKKQNKNDDVIRVLEEIQSHVSTIVSIQYDSAGKITQFFEPTLDTPAFTLEHRYDFMQAVYFLNAEAAASVKKGLSVQPAAAYQLTPEQMKGGAFLVAAQNQHLRTAGAINKTLNTIIEKLLAENLTQKADLTPDRTFLIGVAKTVLSSPSWVRLLCNENA